MNLRLLTLLAVTVAFGIFSAIVLVEVGYTGIIEPALTEWGPAQVFVDLVILAVLAIIWMVRDARVRGLNAWPFVAITLAAGSFGPLAYLIVREVRSGSRR